MKQTLKDKRKIISRFKKMSVNLLIPVKIIYIENKPFVQCIETKSNYPCNIAKLCDVWRDVSKYNEYLAIIKRIKIETITLRIKEK